MVVALNPLVGLLLVFVLVAANAFFVAVEFALVAVDRTKVDISAKEGDRRSQIVSELLSTVSFQLSGAQLGITISSIVLGFLAEPSIAALLEPLVGATVGDDRAAGISVVIALVIATVFQMLIGELIPKSIAVGKPFVTARRLGPAMRIFTKVCRPLTIVFNESAEVLLKLVGVEPTEELSQVRSRPELVRLLVNSEEEGTLRSAEVALLTKVFRFQEKTVADVLRPRPDVVALSTTASAHELVTTAQSSGFSRFPVTDGDIDHIVGVVHAKAVFDIPAAQRRSVRISDLMVPVTVVPESADVADLMIQMRSGPTQMVVAVDEYGGTAGILTLEDLLEEIVGEIDDEHDQQESHTAVVRYADQFVLAGRLHPDEVFDACGLTIPDGGYETLGGFVLDQLGKIPVEGNSFEFAGWVVEVKEMDRRRVASVRLTPPATADDVGSPDEAEDDR